MSPYPTQNPLRSLTGCSETEIPKPLLQGSRCSVPSPQPHLSSCDLLPLMLLLLQAADTYNCSPCLTLAWIPPLTLPSLAQKAWWDLRWLAAAPPPVLSVLALTCLSQGSLHTCLSPHESPELIERGNPVLSVLPLYHSAWHRPEALGGWTAEGSLQDLDSSQEGLGSGGS